MLREGPSKYIYHTAADPEHGPEKELYNLETDPNEFDNVACDPVHAEQLRCMHQRLVDELGESPEVTEQRCRAEYARGYRAG